MAMNFGCMEYTLHMTHQSMAWFGSNDHQKPCLSQQRYQCNRKCYFEWSSIHKVTSCISWSPGIFYFIVSIVINRKFPFCNNKWLLGLLPSVLLYPFLVGIAMNLNYIALEQRQGECGKKYINNNLIFYEMSHIYNVGPQKKTQELQKHASHGP